LAGYTAIECKDLFPAAEIYHECRKLQEAPHINDQIVCFNKKSVPNSNVWPPIALPGYFYSQVTQLLTTVYCDTYLCAVKQVHPIWNSDGMRNSTKYDRLLEFYFTEQDYHNMRMPIKQCKEKGCTPFRLLLGGYAIHELKSVFDRDMVTATIAASRGKNAEHCRSVLGLSAKAIFECGAYSLKEIFLLLEPIQMCGTLCHKYDGVTIVCRYNCPERFVLNKNPTRRFDMSGLSEERRALEFTYTATECRKLGFSALKASSLVKTYSSRTRFQYLPGDLLEAGYTISELIYGCPIDVLVLCVSQMRRRNGKHEINWTYRIRHFLVQFLKKPSFCKTF